MKVSLYSRFSITVACLIFLLSLCCAAMAQEQTLEKDAQAADQITVLLESYTRLNMTYAECDEILTKYGGYGENQKIYYNRVYSLRNLNTDTFYPIGFWLRLYYSETQSVVFEFEYADDHPVWEQLENESFLLSVYDVAAEGDMKPDDMASAVLAKAYYLLADPAEDAEEETILLKLVIDLEHYKDCHKVTDEWNDDEVLFNIPLF